MTEPLGHEKRDPVRHNSANSRNGAARGTLKGEFGEMGLETPRDRHPCGRSVDAAGSYLHCDKPSAAERKQRLLDDRLIGLAPTWPRR